MFDDINEAGGFKSNQCQPHTRLYKTTAQYSLYWQRDDKFPYVNHAKYLDNKGDPTIASVPPITSL